MFWDLGRSGSFEWVAAEVGVRGVCTSFPGSAEWSEKRALRLRRLESKFWDLGRNGSFEGVAAETGVRGVFGPGLKGFSRVGAKNPACGMNRRPDLEASVNKG